MRLEKPEEERIEEGEALVRHELCRIHDAESRIIPKGRKAGYPENIDFSLLPVRVGSMFHILTGIMQGTIISQFREKAFKRSRREIALFEIVEDISVSLCFLSVK